MSDQIEFQAALANLRGRFDRALVAQWDRGDFATELLRHLRERTQPRLPWTGRKLAQIAQQAARHDPEEYEWELELARRAVAGEVPACSNAHGRIFVTLDRDRFDFSELPGAPDPQSIHGLNRMRWLGPLTRCYWATGEQQFFDTAMRDWDFFARVVPPADDALLGQYHGIGRRGAPPPSYHELDAFIRLTNWWWTFWLFLHADAMTSERCVILLHRAMQGFDVVAARGVRILEHNFTSMQGEALYLWALALPEMPGMRPWKHAARNLLESCMRAGVWDDGVQWEKSADYHIGCIRWYGFSYLLGRDNGEAWPDEYAQRLRLMGEYLDTLITPQGRTPPLSDADSDITWRQALALLRSVFDDVRWHHPVPPTLYSTWVSGGKEWQVTKQAAPPLPASRVFPNGGVAVLRSAGGGEQVIFDNGPTFAGHAHKHNLSFHYHALGQAILVDPGRWVYNTADPMQRWSVSPWAHNTIVIEDEPVSSDHPFDREFFRLIFTHAGQRDPRTGPIEVSESADQLRLRSSFAAFADDPEARVTRTITMPRETSEPWLTVTDAIEGPREHTWTNVFLLPAVVPAKSASGALSVQLNSGLRVTITPDTKLTVRDEPMFWCQQYAIKSPARWLRFSGRCRCAARSFRFTVQGEEGSGMAADERG